MTSENRDPKERLAHARHHIAAVTVWLALGLLGLEARVVIIENIADTGSLAVLTAAAVGLLCRRRRNPVSAPEIVLDPLRSNP